MNSIEGQIIINLYSHDQPGRVEIHSTRALHAAKILVGKTPEQALSIIPLIFNICGIAQSHAGYLAIEQKMANKRDPARETARELLLLAENAREYLLRLFLDAPRLFQIEYHNTKLSYLSCITKDFSAALFEQSKAFSLNSRLNRELENVMQAVDLLEKFLEDHIYQIPLENWLSNNKNSMQQWAKTYDSLAAKIVHILLETDWGAQGYTDCPVLPKLNENILLDIFNAENAKHFIARPEWLGQCFETTALSRQLDHPLIQELSLSYSSGLVTRWVARLIELAKIPAKMRVLLKQLTNHDFSAAVSDHYVCLGIAQVEAARGRLIHRVDIEHGVISQYQILAPTEWNFHPQGMVSQALENIDTKDIRELEQLAHLMINAYDPCVGYQLRVH